MQMTVTGILVVTLDADSDRFSVDADDDDRVGVKSNNMEGRVGHHDPHLSDGTETLHRAFQFTK